MITQDGEMEWLRTSKIPLRDREGQIFGVLGTYEDITGLKRAEMLLAERNQDLVRSNADLEQFAYVASHDLQEPLRMVASFPSCCAGAIRARWTSVVTSSSPTPSTAPSACSS